MKKLTLVLVLAASMSPAFGQGRPNIFAPPPTASGPIAGVVNSIVMAFNNRDTAYLQKNGSGWQIVLIHGAVDTVIAQH